jgi:hypothetical protein
VKRLHGFGDGGLLVWRLYYTNRLAEIVDAQMANAVRLLLPRGRTALIIADRIFEFAIPFGKQGGHDVQAGRSASALWRKLHRLPDIELVPAYLTGGLIQLTQ